MKHWQYLSRIVDRFISGGRPGYALIAVALFATVSIAFSVALTIGVIYGPQTISLARAMIAL